MGENDKLKSQVNLSNDNMNYELYLKEHRLKGYFKRAIKNMADKSGN